MHLASLLALFVWLEFAYVGEAGKHTNRRYSHLIVLFVILFSFWENRWSALVLEETDARLLFLSRKIYC